LNFAGKSYGLIALFLLQLFCVAFLLADATVDILGLEQQPEYGENHVLEYLVVMALIFSLAATGRQVYRLMIRNRNVEDQLKAASGKFSEIMDQHFDDWELTFSERDVAMLAIKGLDIEEIASLRNTKEGTVKAQLNAIYRKSDVTGRPQLISLFIEELMGSGLSDRRTRADKQP